MFRGVALFRILPIGLLITAMLISAENDFYPTLPAKRQGNVVAENGARSSNRHRKLEEDSRKLCDSEISVIRNMGIPHDDVHVLAVSPDGKTIVAGTDGLDIPGGTEITMWDVETGRLIRVIDTPNEVVWGLDICPNGDFFVSGSWDDIIRVFHLESGELLRSWPRNRSWLFALAVTPDCTKVVVGDFGGLVDLWDINTGALLMTLDVGMDVVAGVAVSPDGTKIVATGRGKTSTKLWDLATGDLIHALDLGADGHDATFGVDSSTVILGMDDDKVYVWNTDTNEFLNTMEHRSVESVAVSPDGSRIVSGGYGVKVWDMETGDLLTDLEPEAMAVAFLPDGCGIVSGGYKRRDSDDPYPLLLWGRRSETLSPSISISPVNSPTIPPSSTGPTSLVEPPPRIGVSDEYSLLRVLSFRQQTKVLAFSPVGKSLVAGANFSTLKVFDTETHKLLMNMQHPGDLFTFRFVAVSADGTKIISRSNDNAIKVWRLENGELLLNFQPHVVTTAVAICPAGEKMVSRGQNDEGVWIFAAWNTRTGDLINTFGDGNNARSIAVSPDGKSLVAGNNDGDLTIWSLTGEPVLSSLREHGNSILSIAVSPNGEKIVTSAVDGVKIWDAETAEVLVNVDSSPSEVAVISPDGKRIASSGLRTTANGDEAGVLRLWSMEDGAFLEEKDQEYVPISIAFSPDSVLIATTSFDRKIYLFGSRACANVPQTTLSIGTKVVGESTKLPTNCAALADRDDVFEVQWYCQNVRRVGRKCALTCSSCSGSTSKPCMDDNDATFPAFSVKRLQNVCRHLSRRTFRRTKKLCRWNAEAREQCPGACGVCDA